MIGLFKKRKSKWKIESFGKKTIFNQDLGSHQIILLSENSTQHVFFKNISFITASNAAKNFNSVSFTVEHLVCYRSRECR